MKYVSAFLILIAAVALAGLPACDQATIASGDDHGHGVTADHHQAEHGDGEHEGLDPIAVTLFTSQVQLFMEYPHLVKGEQAQFLAHLTVLATGEPIRSGKLTFEASAPSEAPIRMTLDAPKRDGLFVPQWKPAAAGRYHLKLSVDSPQVRAVVDVGELLVHADAHEAEHVAEEAAGAEPPDMVPFLLEQQWKIGTLYEPVAKRTLVHRLAIPGRIVAPQGASASISPPVSGRLMPPPDGRLPRIGDHVVAGQILALIEPQLSAAEVYELGANRAGIQALETELALRELDLDTKALEVERSILISSARLDYARRALERVSQLREKGVGTEQQHDEAQQNVRLAQAEHQAAQAMKQSYEGARARLAGLRDRAIPDRDGTGSAVAANQMPLAAPITGEIVSVAHIEGEMLDVAHEEVYRIVNRDRVWIEADISEFDLSELTENPGATMVLPAYPTRSFDIIDSGSGHLVNIGSIVDPHTRTVRVVYEMPNPEGLFRIGMFANVFLETRTAVDVVALPEKAIVLDNGQPTAYVLIDGECFQKRKLELGIRDNGWVEAKSGMLEGERVVIRGAYAIKLASLSPAEFGHGHGH